VQPTIPCDAMKIIILVLILPLLSACATQSGQPLYREKVYQVLFHGKKVGNVVHREMQTDNKIQTEEVFQIKTQFRGLAPGYSRLIETQQESLSFKPLSYTRDLQIPNAERQFNASIRHNLWYWRESPDMSIPEESTSLPAHFYLAAGLRAQLEKMTKGQEHVEYQRWNQEQKRFERVVLQLELADTTRNAWKIRQQREFVSAPTFFWIDSAGELLESELEFLGYELKILPCDVDCQNQPLEALRPLDYQMLASPYQLTPSALGGRIRYQLLAGNKLQIPATAEQKVKRNDNGWILEICKECKFPETQPDVGLKDFLQPNRWLETRDPVLVNAVKKKIVSGDSDEKNMNRLVVLTRHRLQNDVQFQGYATASQAYHNGKGDCTEYAVLLATFGRIANIPTRVVFGFSYSRESFHGKRHQFAPHAWVQAWIDGRWKSFDAAFENFDSGHIALVISHGAQQDFASMFNDFEKLKILSAQQLVSKK